MVDEESKSRFALRLRVRGKKIHKRFPYTEANKVDVYERVADFRMQLMVELGQVGVS